MTEYKIQTSAGLGSPGYIDSHAPNGGQWFINGEHAKVKEGIIVQKTGKVNDNPPGYCEIELPVTGGLVWVKSTHLVEIVPPIVVPPVIEPPIVEAQPEQWLLVIGTYRNAQTGQEYLRVRNVSKPEGL